MICTVCGDPLPRGSRRRHCAACGTAPPLGSGIYLPRPAQGSCLGGCGRAVAVVGRFAGWCAVCRADRVQAQPTDVQVAAWALIESEGIR